MEKMEARLLRFPYRSHLPEVIMRHATMRAPNLGFAAKVGAKDVFPTEVSDAEPTKARLATEVG